MTANQHPTPDSTSSPGASCREAVELLPWLLNGALEAEEERWLRDHLEGSPGGGPTKGCEACRAELEATAAAARLFSRHVPSFALASYALGLEPEEPDRRQIEAHLSGCPSCRAELALVRAAEEDPLAESDGELAPVVDLAARRARRDERQSPAAGWRRLALAASLVAAVGLALLLRGFTSPEAPLSPSGSDADRQTASVAAPDVGLFFDGFESGGVSAWTEDDVPSATVEPGSTPRRATGDGFPRRRTNGGFVDSFESGDLSAWSRITG